jgi:RiboL-PSP-HEPN
MIPQYQRTLARCDELMKRAANPDLEGLVISATCQHICVLMAGALETAIKELLAGYCVAKSTPRVAAYSTKRISTFQNADPAKICEVIRQFDPKWSDDIEVFWDEEIKDHIGSIVGNRHLIAHGRPTEVSLARIREWRRSLQKLIDKIAEMTQQ